MSPKDNSHRFIAIHFRIFALEVINSGKILVILEIVSYIPRTAIEVQALRGFNILILPLYSLLTTYFIYQFPLLSYLLCGISKTLRLCSYQDKRQEPLSSHHMGAQYRQERPKRDNKLLQISITDIHIFKSDSTT